jgi:hypothetical protein
MTGALGDNTNSWANVGAASAHDTITAAMKVFMWRIPLSCGLSINYISDAWRYNGRDVTFAVERKNGGCEFS